MKMAKILIVDDEQNIRNILCETLKKDEYEIFEASSGQEAIDILDSNAVDLMITDLVMPGKTGLDLIMEIKEKIPEINIIAISGGGGINGRFDYLPIAQLIGANNIIRKPFSMADIKKIVSDLLAA